MVLFSGDWVVLVGFLFSFSQFWVIHVLWKAERMDDKICFYKTITMFCKDISCSWTTKTGSKQKWLCVKCYFCHFCPCQHECLFGEDWRPRIFNPAHLMLFLVILAKISLISLNDLVCNAVASSGKVGNCNRFSSPSTMVATENTKSPCSTCATI